MGRKKLIILASVVLFIGITITILYFVAINHAKSSIEELVRTESKGQLIFDAGKANFKLFELRFELDQPDFRTKDTSTTLTGYHITSEKIVFNAESLLSFLFSRRFIVDSVRIDSPLIEVYKYNQGPQSEISLATEMGKVYQGLEKVLNIVYLNHLNINSAGLIVYDKLNNKENPLTVNRINLTIKGVNNKDTTGNKRFLYADRILLEVFDQKILSANGTHGVNFKRFSLNTQNQTIELDSCYVYLNQTNHMSAELGTMMDTLRITNLDFNLLAQHEILKMDSALCINPDIKVFLPLKDSNEGATVDIKSNLMHKDSLDFLVKNILGNLDIGYLTVKNAKINIVTQKNLVKNTFNSSNTHFTIKNLIVSKDPKIPLQLGSFDLDIQDYKSYSSDSMYVMRYDKVQILNKTISLINFRFGPTQANHDILTKEISMKLLRFEEIEWATLLIEKRIVAGKIVLNNPVIDFRFPKIKPSPTQQTSKTNSFNSLQDLRKKIQIQGIYIEDGSINLQVMNGSRFYLHHLYTGINIDKLLESTNVFMAIEAIDTLSFSDGRLQNTSGQFNIKGGNYSQLTHTLKVRQVLQEKKDQDLKIKLNNVTIGGIQLVGIGDYRVDDMKWESAEFDMKAKKMDEKEKSNVVNTMDQKIAIGKVTGGPTKFNFSGINFEASTIVNRVRTGEILYKTGDKLPQISELYIDGQSFNLQKDELNSNMTEFLIHDSHLSHLNNVEVKIPMNNELAVIAIPKLEFSADIRKSLDGGIIAGFIELHQPVISFRQSGNLINSGPKRSGQGIPPLEIGKLILNQPKILNLPAELDGKMKINPGVSMLKLVGIHSDSISLSLDSILFQSTASGFNNNNIFVETAGKEPMILKGSSLTYRPSIDQEKIFWSFKIDAIKISDVNLNTFSSDTLKQSIEIRNFDLENFKLNSNSKQNWQSMLRNNEQLQLLNTTISLKNEQHNLTFNNLNLSSKNKTLTIDSIAFKPSVDRETFMAGQQFRKGHMQVFTGAVKVRGIDFDALNKDTAFHLKRVNVNQIRFINYVDKRLPIEHEVHKPLPTEMIKNIKAKFRIDSLIFTNSMIVHEEFNDKTLKMGKLTFSDIRGGATNLWNYNLTKYDSLKFNVYTKLLDTAEIRVKYKQSYTDSLSSFNLKAIVSSFDLRTMNPILENFASAKVNHGFLDTIRMSVVGRKYVAMGTMKMYYRNLNVEYLNKKDEEKKTIFTRLLTFFANRIVHTKNQYGSGEVYAERDPEKGFVNYWVKIFLGGVFTNTGVRTDKKQERKYEQAIKKNNVPPIPNIPVDY